MVPVPGRAGKKNGAGKGGPRLFLWGRGKLGQGIGERGGSTAYFLKVFQEESTYTLLIPQAKEDSEEM